MLGVQIVHQPLPLRHTVALAAVLGQVAPQGGLPMLVCTQIGGVAVLPGQNPVGAVNQILVVNIRQLPGQVVGRIGAAVQIIGQRGAGGDKFRLPESFTLKQGQQPPAQYFGTERI